MIYRNSIYLLLFVFLASSLVHAQTNRQRRTAERIASQLIYDQNTGKNLRFFMSSRWMNGVDIEFANLGQVNPQIVDDRGDSFGYQFDDGFITIDPTGSEVTSDFGFNYDNSTTNPDGFVDSFSLTGYSSDSAGASTELDPESRLGIEMGLQYFVINRRNFKLGVVGSFGINDLNADTTQTVEGELYQQMATVLIENSQIVPVPGEAYTRSGGSGPVINVNNGILFDPDTRQRVTQEVAGLGEVGVPSQVQGRYNLDGITTGLRAGLVTEFTLGRFWVQAGAGYSAVYTYSDFSVNQSIANANFFSTVDMEADIQDSEWFYGPYGEIRAGFRINPSSRIYFGAMYINMDETFSQSAGGVGNRIGLENPILFEIGVNIDF